MVKKRIKELPTKDIRASLTRVQVSFDFPLDPGKLLHKPARIKPVAPPPKKKAPASLTHLIQAGLLKAPLKLTRRYKGHDLRAELLPDGTVAFQGKKYKSCSAAGAVAKGTVTGQPMSTDGWKFWQYRDENGNLVGLDTVRQNFLKTQVGQVGAEYSEFWDPIRREGLFAGKPVPLRGEGWIQKSIRGIVLCLQLNNHDCSVLLQFKGEDRKRRRNKAVKFFPAPKYAHERHESPKFAYVRFPVLDKGKKDREHWPQIREKLTSVGTEIYNRISDSDV